MLRPIRYLLLCPLALFALPEIKDVVSGKVDIEKSPHQLILHVSDKSIINYNSFNINEFESVQFIQPGKDSSVLNRVLSQDPTAIFGKLSSNGKLILINPNGIFFGPSAKVNVGTLIASTLDIQNDDFTNDRFHFALGESSRGSRIENLGHLEAADGGSILLLAPHIQNNGSLIAKTGHVELLSGEKITLDFAGDGLISFSVDGEMEDALIEHMGKIEAKNVQLHMKTAERVVQEVLNTDGIEEGVQISIKNGVIRLLAASEIEAERIATDAPRVEIESSLRAPGGEIHVLGDSIVLRGATVDVSNAQGAGEILVGGDYQGKGDIRRSAHVSVDEGTSLLANANLDGDGGKVIVWADQIGRFAGEIEAKGGLVGGNGGLVETSSAGWMDLSSRVNTFAPQGSMGNWLIDPANITVVTGGLATRDQVADCGDVGSTFSIAPSTIEAAVSQVTLCASTNITVSSSINMPNNTVGLLLTGGSGGTPSINLDANITTKSGPIIINGDVTLGATVTLDTTGAGNGADVQINGTVNGTQNLTITSGTGQIDVTGMIGGVTPLADLTLSGNGGIILNGITDAAQVSLTSLLGITLNNGTYTATSHNYSGHITLGANTQITSAMNNNITIGGNIQGDGVMARTLTVDTGGAGSTGNISVSSIGTNVALGGITLNAYDGTISMGGVGSGISTGSTNGLDLSAAGGITLNGALYHTSGGAQTFNSPVILAATTIFNTHDQNLSFQNTLNGAFPASIAAGTGALLFNGQVGSAMTPIGGVTINSASSVTANSDFYAASFREQTSTGPNAFNGSLNTTGTAGIIINGTTVDFTGVVTTGGTGAISITNSDVLTIPSGAAVSSGRSFFQGGGGAFFLGDDITAAEDQIVISSPLTLTADSAINAGFSSGDILFGSTIDGGFDLELTCAGLLRVSGAIGSVTPLIGLTIGNNGGIILSDIGTPTTSGAETLQLQTTGSFIFTGTTYTADTHQYTGNLTLSLGATITSSADITVNGLIDSVSVTPANLTMSTGMPASTGNISIRGLGTNLTLGSIDLNANMGTITIGSVGSGTATGATNGLTIASTNLGSGILLNGGVYHTSGGPMTYQGNAVIGSTTVLTSENQPILFTGTLDGTDPTIQSLVLEAGTSSITFTGAVGATTRLGGTRVLSANGVTALDALYVRSFHEESSLMGGTGATTLHLIDTNDHIGIILDATTIDFLGPITTTDHGSLKISNTGTVTFDPAASTNLDGPLAQDGSGSIALGANITTSNDSISFESNVTLTNPVVLDTGPGSGDIIFLGTVDGPHGLTLTAGAGQVDIAGSLGPNITTLIASGDGSINIQNITTTGATTLTTSSALVLHGTTYQAAAHTYTGNTILKASPTITSTAGAIQLIGTIDGDGVLSRSLNITSVGGGITIGSTIGSTVALGGLTLNAGGALSLGSVGSGTAVGSTNGMSLTGSGGITINGGLYHTSGGAQNYVSPVTVATTTIFNTESQPLTFQSTLNGLTVGGQPLSIAAGTGALSFNDQVGNLTRLGGVTINSAGSVTAQNNFYANSIREQAPTGINQFNGAAASLFTTAVAGITLNGSNITFVGPITTGGGGSINITNSGVLTIPTTAAITAAGSFAQTGSGSVLLGTNISTTNDHISIDNPLTLTNNIVFDTGAISGDIFFGSTIDGAFSLSATTPGLITVTGSVGVTTPLNVLTLNGHGGMILHNIGTSMADGAATVSLSTLGGITLQGTNYRAGTQAFGGNVLLANNPISLISSGTLSITGSLDGDGVSSRSLSMTSSGGNVSIVGGTGMLVPVGSLSLTTTDNTKTVSLGNVGRGGNAGVTGGLILNSAMTSGNAIFLMGAIYNISGNPTTFTTNVQVRPATSLAITSFNQPIQFQGNVNGLTAGGQGLVLSSGTAAITFDGSIGDTTPLGAITINSANGVTASGTITAASIQELTDTGANSFQAIDTLNAAGIVLNGTTVNLAGPITTANGGPLYIANSSTLTIPASSSLNLDGAFTQLGAGPVSLGTNTITTNDNISFSSNVSLTNTILLDTASGFGDIIFGGNINGPHGLTLTAGSGQVSITGQVGPNITSLAASGNGSINIGDVTTTGALTLTTSSTLVLHGTTYSATTHAYTGNTVLKANATIQSPGLIQLVGTIDGDGVLSRSFTANSTAGNIIINSTIGSTVSLGALSLTAGGTLTLGSVGSGVLAGSTGGMSLTAAGGIVINGGLYHTSGAAQDYLSPTTLGATTIFNTENQNLHFHNTLNALTAGGQPISIAAGTGALLFDGNVGNLQRLGAITINSAASVTANGNLRTNSLREQAATGINQFNGTTDAIFTTATAGIVLNGTSFSFAGPITTGTNAPVNITHSGVLTLTGASPLNIGGSFTQMGSGTVALGVGITTNDTDIFFEGPVNLTASLTLNTGSGAGDLFFKNSLSGATDLTIQAGMGAVRFDQPIGPFNSLTASGAMIHQSNTATVTGPLSYAGQVMLANQITASDIAVNGDLLQITNSNITLTANTGNLAISGTINGDTAGRNLTLNASTGSVTLGGVIGSVTALNNLSVTANQISLEGIGGKDVGVAGALTLTSAGQVQFNGTNYIANNQSYTGTFFDCDASSGTLFSALSGPITFNGGQIRLANQSNLMLLTLTGNISFSSLIGTSDENVYISSNAGSLNLGSIGAGTSDINEVACSGGQIVFNGDIQAKSGNFISQGSILNGNPAVDIACSTYLIFNAKGGSVGTALSPIKISSMLFDPAPALLHPTTAFHLLSTSGHFAANPLLVDTGFVATGATGTANFVGTTGDGTVHCLPQNPPTQTLFNGNVVCTLSPTPPSPPAPSPPAPSPSPTPAPMPVTLPPTRAIFLHLPAQIFFVPGTYSPINNWSDDSYFFLFRLNDDYLIRTVPIFSLKTHTPSRSKPSPLKL